MKTRGLLLLSLLMFVSCSSDPQTKRLQVYTAVQEGYITTVEHLTNKAKRGEYTEKQWTNEVLPLINTTNHAMDMYYAVIKTGKPAPDQLETIRVLLKQLKSYIERTQ